MKIRVYPQDTRVYPQHTKGLSQDIKGWSLDIQGLFSKAKVWLHLHSYIEHMGHVSHNLKDGFEFISVHWGHSYGGKLELNLWESLVWSFLFIWITWILQIMCQYPEQDIFQDTFTMCSQECSKIVFISKIHVMKIIKIRSKQGYSINITKVVLLVSP